MRLHAPRVASSLCGLVGSSLLLALVTVSLAACDKKTPPPTPTADPAKAPAAGSADMVASAAGSAGTPIPTPGAAASAEPAAPPVEPVCKVASQKIWTKGVNPVTGITAVELPDGRDVVGFAIGNVPHVLAIDAGGVGKMSKVLVDPGSLFAKAPKKDEGSRAVLRVTPVKLGQSSAHAFVDFRDDLKIAAVPGKPEITKARRVVCGPVDRPETWVSWEGPAYLDDAKLGKEPLTTLKAAGSLEAGKPYREVRDCRSFYDAPHDDEWIVGSELVIQAEGSASARAQLFVERGKDGSRDPVATLDLATDPFRLAGFDTPVSHELGDGAYLVAARAPGKLLAMVVDHEKKPLGKTTEYKGSYQMPDLAQDGKDDVLTTAQTVGTDKLALRALRIPGDTRALPAGFVPVIGDADDSKTEGRPEFLRDEKGQRWLAYIEDADKGKGHLEILPLTAGFRAAGKPYAVTEGNERATEARLFAKKGGGFLVVYLRADGPANTELVTEDLVCEIKAEGAR